ncbi:cadherin repeat domain-containing protein [Tenuifilum thalassicum]|nr:SusF/SusE family outer membrane protein [Tenuifilum thalassicum]
MRKPKLRLMWLLAAATMIFAACNKDDGNDGPTILVEDGLYIVGEATPWTDYDLKGQFAGGINEADNQQPRATMFEKYVALEAGKTFKIVEIAGKEAIEYGPDNLMDVATEGLREQPNVTAKVGSFKTGGEYTVAESGLYHIILDKELSKVAIIPVPYWGILGGSSPYGWNDDNTHMELVGAFDKNELVFEITDLELREGDFKFRYGSGWKFELDEEGTVKANTNFGGAVDALVPGGSNIALAKENEGIYTVRMKWSAQTGGLGMTAELVKTGDVEPLPEYPTELFMIGNALNSEDSDNDGTPDGWQWNLTDAPMVPVHSHEYMFWKIVWLNAGGEFKFAPEKAWGKDFGKTGEASADTVYAKGSDNIPAPSTSGYYMVVVDLKENKIIISDPKVYLIGTTVGDNWTAPVADAKFTVDNANEVITLTKALDAGDLRMHVWHKWFPVQDPQPVDWWQAEFIILNNKIEFRGNGNDQERVNLTAGTYKIDLNFKTGDGTITAQ